MAYYDVSNEEDLNQDLARSAFGDMLLDDDRNERYKQALITVIQEKHAKGEQANVVDIGTGSGLLSLLAAQAGADSVTAVEVFTPMAEVAEQIFKKNGYGEKIELLKSRSTDCHAREIFLFWVTFCLNLNFDFLEPTTSKGNIVVAEVFDT